MKTRRRKNRAKATARLNAVTKRMQKEDADRERTGKPHPSARCAASRGLHECTKAPNHPRKHRDGSYEWSDERPLLTEVNAVNAKLTRGSFRIDLTNGPWVGFGSGGRLVRVRLDGDTTSLVFEDEVVDLNCPPVWEAILEHMRVPRSVPTVEASR